MDEAFEFLKESAWILEDAGFQNYYSGVLTPKVAAGESSFAFGGKAKSASASAQAYFSMETLTDYHYELAIGDETLTLKNGSSW